ncbi:hypothetical protein J4439_07665 [Candidatus Woesearchaeota archaeon]|nr:hypothetical protein [Candidatus Woesearchaeota archaeon]
MFFDIVEPQGNEQALIAMAKRLSIGGLVMLYPKRAELPAAEGLVLVPGRISDGARKDPLVFSVAMTAEPDMALQNGVDAIFGMELATRQDGLHARHSGMNQVRCAAAKEKDVLTGIALRPMLEAGPYLRARLLGRHSQNLRICENRCAVTIASLARHPYQMRSPQEMRSLLAVMGATTEQAAAAMAATRERAQRVLDAHEGVLHGQGISARPIPQKSPKES